MNLTLQYYDSNACEVADTYEKIDFSTVRQQIASYFPLHGKILELGCGSGRDANIFFEYGYDVYALDGSKEMINQAINYYPKLKNRLKVHELPKVLPYAERSFDIVYAMAILMHLTSRQTMYVLKDLNRVLKKNGIFAFSTTTAREDIDDKGYDKKGRFFSTCSLDDCINICEHNSFTVIEAWESPDIVKRQGIFWGTVVARKN